MGGDSDNSCCNTLKRMLAGIALIIAIGDIIVETVIYNKFKSYEPDTICCGLVAEDISDNADGVICDLETIKDYGLGIDEDNICVVQGETCDLWNNRNNDLDDCLISAGYDIDDLCDRNTMIEALGAFNEQLKFYFILVMVGVSINALMDIFELFCPKEDNEAKNLCRWLGYHLFCCCIIPYKNQKRKKTIAFWLLQLLVWGFALAYTTLLSSGTETGYQQFGQFSPNDEDGIATNEFGN